MGTFTQCTEVRFASLLSGGFTTVAVINPLEKKLANCTSAQCVKSARSTQRVENITFSLSHTCYKPLLLLKLAAALHTVHN